MFSAWAGFDKELMRLAKVKTRLRVFADLSLCWSPLPHCWKSIVVALSCLLFTKCTLYVFQIDFIFFRIRKKRKDVKIKEMNEGNEEMNE